MQKQQTRPRQQRPALPAQQVQPAGLVVPKTSRLYYDFILGGENELSIPVNNDLVEAFSIKNNTGFDLFVLGIQTRFSDGLEDCIINLIQVGDKTIVDGRTQLTQIGNRIKADVSRDELPVNFPLSANATVRIKLATKNVAITTGDVSVTLFCRKVPKSAR
ncbi:MAG: hypothetical protein AAF518_14475 [Spirochaetota bacterium]